MRLPRRLAYVLAAFIAAGAGLLTAVLLRDGEAPQPASGVYLDRPRPVADFALLDHEGRTFTPEELEGHWTLLFAGFTHCPDVCPTTLGLLRDVQERLGTQAEALRVVLLSVDPERDTPEILSRYVRHFSPRFTGVTGPVTEIDKLASSLGIAYAKVPGETPEQYTMDHSAVVVLLNPEGMIHGYFTPRLDADLLTQDLARLLERA